MGDKAVQSVTREKKKRTATLRLHCEQKELAPDGQNPSEGKKKRWGLYDGHPFFAAEEKREKIRTVSTFPLAARPKEGGQKGTRRFLFS